MKRIFFIQVIFFLNVVVGFSQAPKMQVNSNSVIIGKDVPAQTSIAQVRMSNTLSSFSRTMWIENTYGNGNGLFVDLPNMGTNTGSFRIGYQASSLSGGAQDCAFRGSVYNASPTSSGRAFGVWGQAGNATSGWNYGVYGEIIGTNNGSAVFGKAQNYTITGTSGQFAGFFVGTTYVSYRLGIANSAPSYPLDVTGTIRCTSLTQTSDIRTKTNIANLNSTSAQVAKLRPVTYHLKQDLSEYYDIYHKSGVADTSKTVISNDDDLMKYFGLDENRYDGRKHIGFIAQEFKEVFPELVYEDDKGMLSIDYVSLVPVLVQTIQELNQRLEALENKNEFAGSASGNGANNFSFSLFPNPTNGFVTIDYSIFVDAPLSIELYNVYGQRVKLIVPSQNKKAGQYSVQTSVSDLGTGTFVVKVTSGSQVESKQLIVNN